MDSVPESPSTHQFAEDSTTTADGVRGGEWLATTADESTTRATESFEAEAGATNIMPESRVQRPASSEEQTTCPEMPQGVVGRFMQPPSPQGVPPAVEEEDKVEEIEREESRPQAIRILRK